MAGAPDLAAVAGLEHILVEVAPRQRGLAIREGQGGIGFRRVRPHLAAVLATLRLQGKGTASALKAVEHTRKGTASALKAVETEEKAPHQP